MKPLKSIFTVILFTVSFSLIAQDKMANNIDNSNIALNGYSPVSYLDLGLAQRGDKKFKSEIEKVVYYFTSEEQKKNFDENPSKYKPQYGGYCAFGTYAGAKFRVDPNKFLVENGKYYLFLNNLELDAQQLWMMENNHAKLQEIADKNWNSLKKTYN